MTLQIEKILTASGFCATELEGLDSIKLYAKDNINGLISSAFVVAEITNVEIQSVLVDLQLSIAQRLESLGTPGSLEKNTTLILLYEYSEKLRDQALQYVTEIEEDQYFFKKQVLFYTPKEKDLLTSIIKNESPVSALEQILYDQAAFNKYSEGNCDGRYAIVSRAFAKLPFLTVQRAAQSRPDLGGAIRGELEKKGLIELRDKLLKIGGNQTNFDEWIKEIMDGDQQ